MTETSFGPMRRDELSYRMSWWFLAKHSGVLTALARRAIDEAVAAASTKMLFPEWVPLIDRADLPRAARSSLHRPACGEMFTPRVE